MLHVATTTDLRRLDGLVHQIQHVRELRLQLCAPHLMRRIA
jgi:hypothetical protein